MLCYVMLCYVYYYDTRLEKFHNIVKYTMKIKLKLDNKLQDIPYYNNNNKHDHDNESSYEPTRYRVI